VKLKIKKKNSLEELTFITAKLLNTVADAYGMKNKRNRNNKSSMHRLIKKI
jgi:hypothetical protein